MDKDALLVIEVELTKMNTLLEHLWAMSAKMAGASVDDVIRVGEEACRQFDTLPGADYGKPAYEGHHARLMALASERLAEFFGRVVARIAQAQ